MGFRGHLYLSVSIPVFELEQASDRPNERVDEQFLQLHLDVGAESGAPRPRGHARDQVAQPRGDPDATGRHHLQQRQEWQALMR